MIKNILATIGAGTVLYAAGKLFRLLVDAQVKYELEQARTRTTT